MRTCCILILLAVPLAGCVPSVNPIYTDKDVVYMPELLGKWAPENSKESWEVTDGGEKSYNAVYTDDKGGQYTFSIHLTQIGDALFADLYPEDWKFEGSDNVDDLILLHLIPAHNFVRLETGENKIRAWAMDCSWVSDYVKRHRFAPRYEEREDNIVFTASTRKLRRFLGRQIHVKEAFAEDDEIVLVRAPAVDEAAEIAPAPEAPASETPAPQ